MYESKYFIEKNEIKGIDWIPRGFFIFVAALFILLSVDVFLEDYTPLETVAGLFFQILPGFFIAGILKLTWKRDFLGFAIFFPLGIFVFFVFNPNYNVVYGILILGMSLIYFKSWLNTVNDKAKLSDLH
ncbi:MAG: hypothetical protein HeimC2_33590 [Candidatus Heimdallarchaeota archaeon LC_2]|nr:MAG: hypothetical protein HeimC2_33590 [Candidatus Heimdallarchaeota archaeon LC_2]